MDIQVFETKKHRSVIKLLRSQPKRPLLSLIVAMSLSAGMSAGLVDLKQNNSKGFDYQPIRSLIAAVQDKTESGKVCTSCQKWLPTPEYHSNKSKKDNLDSHCKTCVSHRKERKRKQLNRTRKKCLEFQSVIVGELEFEELQLFAEILGATIKEVLNDGKKEVHSVRGEITCLKNGSALSNQSSHTNEKMEATK